MLEHILTLLRGDLCCLFGIIHCIQESCIHKMKESFLAYSAQMPEQNANRLYNVCNYLYVRDSCTP